MRCKYYSRNLYYLIAVVNIKHDCLNRILQNYKITLLYNRELMIYYQFIRINHFLIKYFQDIDSIIKVLDVDFIQGLGC